MTRPRPKSVVLDVMWTLKGRAAPVRFLIATAEIFGIDPNATRVAITRLLSAGLIERDDRGYYRTGAAADPILQRLAGWRSIEKRTRAWDGSWVGATPDTLAFDKDKRALALRAIGFLGMREFAPGLWIRPENLACELEGAREALRALGMPEECPVFRIRDLDEAGDARARNLWTGDDIPSSYADLAAELRRSAAELENLPERDALAESFLLGGEAIRRLVLDPLLPDEIVPTAGRDDLLHTMIEYDRVGRRYWIPFLARYGVDAGDPPMDRQAWREAEGAQALEAAEQAQ